MSVKSQTSKVYFVHTCILKLNKYTDIYSILAMMPTSFFPTPKICEKLGVLYFKGIAHAFFINRTVNRPWECKYFLNPHQ